MRECRVDYDVVSMNRPFARDQDEQDIISAGPQSATSLNQLSE